MPNNLLVDLFEGLELFKSFPPDLLEQFATLVEVEPITQGQVLLQQGETNSTLYFLLEGSISVYVDGGLVARLDRRGDLIGEMSVIRQNECSATTMAETDGKLLKVDSSRFNEIPEEDYDLFQHLLFRLFALILTEKLEVTNQKAKYFEGLTLELKSAKKELEKSNLHLEDEVKKRTADLEQKTQDLLASHQRLESQNAELIASHKKLDDIYSSRDLTFERLNELYSDHLPALEFTLKQFEQETGGASSEFLSRAKKELQHLVKTLEPVAASYSAERTMRNKKVLLAEPNRRQQAIARLALGGTGVDLQIGSSTQEAKEILDQGEFDIILVDSETLDLMDHLEKVGSNARVVYMTSDRVPSYLPKLTGRNQLPNIVSTDVNDRVFTVKNIMTTVTKLASSDVFGMEKYLSWGVDVQEKEVKNSTQRPELIAQMNEYFSRLGVRRTNCDRASLVVEELLMNAIYDAPVDKKGQSLYNHLQRTVAVNLKVNERAKLRYALDGLLMAVSVEDPFGALKGQTILHYLESCYGGRAGSLNKEKGGAGRGLHQIVENSDLVVFNVARHRRTEVIALFNLDLKASADKNPSFHYFFQ